MVTAVTLGKLLGIAVGSGIGLHVAAVVVNLAISALLGKILAPEVPQSARDTKALQSTISSNISPRRVCYGEAITGGPFLLMETWGSSNQFLNMVIALTTHPIEDVIGVFIDDQYVHIAGQGGATNTATNDLDTDYYVNVGKYGIGEATQHVRIIKNLGWGYADFDYVTDTDSVKAQNDRLRTQLINEVLEQQWSPPLPNNSSSRNGTTGLYSSGYKATNCAYIMLHFVYNPDVWTSIPKVKFHIKGKTLYNPQQDASLVSLGADSAGLHDLSDPDTWEWTDNWALCILDYLKDNIFGLGAKTSGELVEIDWAEAITAYNNSAEIIPNGYTTPFAGNVSRYTLNGIFEVSATPISNMEAMLSCGTGELIYSQGKYKIRAGVYRPPAGDASVINEDMITSPLNIRTHTPRSDLFNKVAGIYVEAGYDRDLTPSDSSNKPIFEPSDFPIVDPLDGGLNPYETIDGEEIIKEIYSQVQQLVKAKNGIDY